MKTDILKKTLFTWFLFVPLPIINGILREAFYKKIIGVQMAEIFGTIFIYVAFVIVANLFFRKIITGLSNNTLLTIGFIWVAMTVVFELGLGIFVLGQPMQELLQAYNLLAGRIWSIVVLTIFFTPFIVRRLQKSEE